MSNEIAEKLNVIPEEEFLGLWGFARQLSRDIYNKSESGAYKISGKDDVDTGESIISVQWQIENPNDKNKMTALERAQTFALLGEAIASVYHGRKEEHELEMRLSDGHELKLIAKKER